MSTSVNIDHRKGTEHRLPSIVVPEHYQLTLEPNLEGKDYIGSVIIDVRVLETTDSIFINAKELGISEAYATNSASKKIAGSVTLEPQKERALISFTENLTEGSWKLFISFTGIHNDTLRGFYRSSWKDESGKSHNLVTSQFEPTDARRAFPCFDEPALKAAYEVTLVVPKHLTAISNGRITSQSDVPGTNKKTVRFRKTMKMSTYLLAFIVGDFEPSETVRVNGIDLTAWTVPGKKHLTAFALKCGAFAIDYFEKYFRVKYPDADKCDLIAIPDFAHGAMENKDCITFRETALLVDEATATHAELKRVAEVVLHELAHMWFGDLVTMRWWNGLWLNEAFATFMEAKCLDTFHKDWNIWDGFGIDRAAASRVDALKSTHPIECPVHSPEEVKELFDAISYQKGCSVLYQIEQFIGEEVFRNGITQYLQAHSFANTETHDLWDSLEFACREAGQDTPVRSIMDKWVFTAGHPMLTVSCKNTNGTIDIEQQQFKYLPETAESTLYPVPITMKVKGEGGKKEEQKFLLIDKRQSVKIGDRFQWLVLNANGSGFYRVRYAPDLASKLTAKVHENLSVIERFNLINDSWAAVRAGIMPASEFLDTVKLFRDEDDINVWAIITGAISSLHSLVKDKPRAAIKQLIRDLYQPNAKKLGWEPKGDENVQIRQLRGSLLGALGTIGEDNDVRVTAVEKFNAWKKDKSAVDSNVFPAVVSTLAYIGDSQRFEEFRQLSKAGKTPQEILRFLSALTQFRELELLKKAMQICLSEEVRTQDAPFIFGAIGANEIGTEAAWQFMQTNWEKMVASYPDTGVVRMCSMIIPTLDEPELEKEAQKFFASHKVKAGDMAVAQALEQLRINVLVRQRETKRLADYLLNS